MLKVTVTLNNDILRFVDEQAQGNRSGYINAVLAEHRRCVLEAEMVAALKQDTEDTEYQAEIAAWDSVVGHGIDAEG
ncbi:MAG: CopG family transcriptional regulator [Aphanothece sp. CMT-3BRIN-NPC111]|jgi:hypothetical protein|nr:CopG family transcriptional regulator [Aphanothece sp. CMT-3BRIN-NPC111]